MFIKRDFWLNLITKAWQERNIIWLMGVRRVGKTSLCKSIPNIVYLDCERPKVRQLLADAEAFLASHKDQTIALDEIHRLDNPSEILKIAADHFPSVKIIATGSSTLGASAKFRDTLTGRKREIWLSPMLLTESQLFGNQNIRHRFLFGGLPAFFAASSLPETDMKEWIDAYWAKDIQEMFSVGKRYSFQKFTELLFAHSAGQFEATRFSTPCEVTRQTISNYLAILEETFVIHVIRPFSSYKPNEITMAPKVYSFDTAFTCFAKGWHELQQENLDLLWEQVVLNELLAQLQPITIKYWRDKSGHEIDFVLEEDKKNNKVHIIECKFNCAAKIQDPRFFNQLSLNILAFRKLYPDGENFIVSHDIEWPLEKTSNNLQLNFVNPEILLTNLKTKLNT